MHRHIDAFMCSCAFQTNDRPTKFPEYIKSKHKCKGQLIATSR